MTRKYLLFLACAVYMTAAFTVTTYTYKTVGDVKIDLDVYIPDTAPPSTGYPIFFAIHGGGDIFGGKQGAFSSQEGMEALNRGWAIVSIDYRLIPGVVLADITEDVQDAYQYVRTELIKTYPLNLNLVTVFGQSAGGGLAVLSGYKLTPRPQAVIAYYSFCTNWTDPYSYKPGVPDPIIVAAANKLAVPVVTEYSVTNSTDPKNALWTAALVSGKMGWLVTTHDPNLPADQILASLKTFSASENVDANYPPTFLGHGLADSLVPYSQSVQMANKLKEFNVPYILDLVPNANHGYDGDANLWQQHVLPAFDFAQKYMQSSGTKTKATVKFLEI